MANLISLPVTETELQTIHLALEAYHMDAERKRAIAYNGGSAELYKTWGEIASKRRDLALRLAGIRASIEQD